MVHAFYLRWTVFLDSPDRLPLRLGTAPQKKGEATGEQTPAHSPEFNNGVFIEAGISDRTIHAVAVTPPSQSWGSPDFVDTGQGFTEVSVRVLLNCCS